MNDKFATADALPDTPEEAPPVPMPLVGTLKLSYGKGVKMWKPTCKTCAPPYMGRPYDKQFDAFQAAVLHAMASHGWIPQGSVQSDSEVS